MEVLEQCHEEVFIFHGEPPVSEPPLVETDNLEFYDKKGQEEEEDSGGYSSSGSSFVSYENKLYDPEDQSSVSSEMEDFIVSDDAPVEHTRLRKRAKCTRRENREKLKVRIFHHSDEEEEDEEDEEKCSC